MKKLLFIALVATATSVVSCSNDSDTFTPSSDNFHTIQDDLLLTQKEDDTINLVDTGGQGGTIPPPPPVTNP